MKQLLSAEWLAVIAVIPLFLALMLREYLVLFGDQVRTAAMRRALLLAIVPLSVACAAVIMARFAVIR